MKIVLACIVFLLALAGCKSPHDEKPVWVNKVPTLFVSEGNLVFRAQGEKWQARMLSFIQPIALPINYTTGGFTIALKDMKGVVEGPAVVCLFTDTDFFYYPVALKNKGALTTTKRDYRSPKTVNPDSSLLQQKIVHVFDQYRNLVRLPEKQTFFFEEENSLTPRAGIYHAIKEDDLTSYYVQPGSCTAIPVQAKYSDETKSYRVAAGPLKDRYNNTVADGTLVSFVYADAVQTYHLEATLLNGFAIITIPADANKRYQLNAFINNTVSEKISLAP